MRAGEAGLVATVSTVKDSTENLLRFVQRNLAAGADHMFLFIDDADEDVQKRLAAEPHVTAVRTGRRYWHGERPASLNRRQLVNANVANVALTACPEVRWLFHLDGDELLHLDRDRLVRLDDSIPVVELQTWEAVAKSRWDGPVTQFKRQLDFDELALLYLLGVVDKPALGRYFRGHRRKVGMRPNLELKLRIHEVARLDQSSVETYKADWLHVLHYESHSGEEFVRKWMAHLSSGGAGHRPHRDRMRGAITAIVHNAVLDEDAKRELLEVFFQRNVADDVETLDRLGYLVRPDEALHRHRPLGLPRDAHAATDQLVRLLASAKKDAFTRDPDAPHPGTVLERIRAGLRPEDPLARRLSASRA